MTDGVKTAASGMGWENCEKSMKKGAAGTRVGTTAAGGMPQVNASGWTLEKYTQNSVSQSKCHMSVHTRA